MPSSIDHLRRARNNERFFRALPIDTTPYPDWILVGAFLSALHLVEAVLVDKGTIARDHQSRNMLISRDPDLRLISSPYRKLKKHNEFARYELVAYPPPIIRGTILPLFTQIKQHIEGLPNIAPHVPSLPPATGP